MSTDPQRYERLHAIYTEASAIDDDDERNAYLDQSCGDDVALRAEVSAILRVGREEPLLHDLLDTIIDRRRREVEALFEQGATAPAAPSQVDAPMPSRIGGYEVRRIIGHGGMGVVYEAEQPSPRRRVAIKIIAPSVIAPGLLRRFQYESEVLGRLQHPGVAQIYEAGTCDLGAGPQPFFAMEYIEGESLLHYCNARDLGTRSRLELLAKVCDAVQHAHQRGVIHRDLKPANILVTPEGQPKVLDFGVARATDSDLQATTIMTDAGSLVGTVPYMSPEQARGDASKLDTRSDVYALGVIAYQLLTRRLPYDLSEKMVHEAVRMIVEDEPPPMSSIDRSLRGDVETVIGKALEKDPGRRYVSAAALADDVRRYLSNQPISARPPSAVYQFRKYAHRNKAVVGGAAAVFVALVIGTIFSTVFAVRAEIARAEAVVSRNVAIESEAMAEASHDSQLAVINFYNKDVLSLASTRPVDFTVRDALREAAAKIEEAAAPGGYFHEYPLAEASVRNILGSQFSNLGEPQLAKQLYERAYELRRQELGRAHSDTLGVLYNLAILSYQLGDYEEAARIAEERLEAEREASDQLTHGILQTMSVLAKIYATLKRFDEAVQILEEMIRLAPDVLGPDHADLLDAQSALGVIYRMMGDHDRAAQQLEIVLESQQRLMGEDALGALATQIALATAYTNAGRYDEAIEVYEDNLERWIRLRGPDNPKTLESETQYAHALRLKGELAEAEARYRRCRDGFIAVYGTDHPYVRIATAGLAQTLEELGRDEEAAELRARLETESVPE